MRMLLAIAGSFLLSCGNEMEKPSDIKRTAITNTTKIFSTSIDTNKAVAKDSPGIILPAVVSIKKPSGIYQFVLPYDGKNILHTVAFYPTSFRLQEEYGEKRDSTIVTEGTWSPSQGNIWLYKDQVVSGRYSWKGDTLQYFSPRLQKLFSMHKLTTAGNNAVWRDKKKSGAILYGVGTEPFWSLEINKLDTLIFSSPEWNTPLKVKLLDAVKRRDSTVYMAAQDSIQVVLYPFFCSDGMSDFTYTNKVKITFKGQVYKGCGIVF